MTSAFLCHQYDAPNALKRVYSISNIMVMKMHIPASFLASYGLGYEFRVFSQTLPNW